MQGTAQLACDRYGQLGGGLGVLEQLADAPEAARRGGAVARAVIEAVGEHADRPDLDGVAAGMLDHDGARGHAIGAGRARRRAVLAAARKHVLAID